MAEIITEKLQISGPKTLKRSYCVTVFFQEKSVFGWQVSAKIGVRLIAKYFHTTKEKDTSCLFKKNSAFRVL